VKKKKEENPKLDLVGLGVNKKKGPYNCVTPSKKERSRHAGRRKGGKGVRRNFEYSPFDLRREAGDRGPSICSGREGRRKGSIEGTSRGRGTGGKEKKMMPGSALLFDYALRALAKRKNRLDDDTPTLKKGRKVGLRAAPRRKVEKREKKKGSKRISI